mgnify:FL=1
MKTISSTVEEGTGSEEGHRVPAEDALKYAAALARDKIARTIGRLDADFELAGRSFSEDHSLEVAGLDRLIASLHRLAADHGDIDTYSDGRQVTSRKELSEGVVIEHIWDPDPTYEEQWSSLLSPVGEWTPTIAFCSVSTDPVTQELNVRLNILT